MKAPYTAPRTEGELQKWFVKELRKEGYLVYKFSSPAKRGVPDLLIIDYDGDAFFVEMKHPNGKGKISPLQKVEFRKMLTQGCRLHIASSVDDCILIMEHGMKELSHANV